MWLRVCGSRPIVGSSRKSTRGECSRPRAISSRRFMPPENVRTRLARRSARPTISSTASIRVATSARRHAVQLGVEAEVLRRRQVVVEGRVLEDEADPAADAQRLGDDVEPGDRARAPRSGAGACRGSRSSSTSRPRSGRGTRTSRRGPRRTSRPAPPPPARSASSGRARRSPRRPRSRTGRAAARRVRVPSFRPR